MTTRDEYTEMMKKELDTMNANMDSLEAKAQELKDDARHLYQENMRKLRHESKMASAKLDELRASSGETWDAMVMEMEKVRDAFTHSFSYFKSQIK